MKSSLILALALLILGASAHADVFVHQARSDLEQQTLRRIQSSSHSAHRPIEILSPATRREGELVSLEISALARKPRISLHFRGDTPRKSVVLEIECPSTAQAQAIARTLRDEVHEDGALNLWFDPRSALKRFEYFEGMSIAMENVFFSDEDGNLQPLAKLPNE